MSSICDLEPKQLWNFFHEITQIPRPSKHEQKMVEFMKEFGKKHKLETIVDKVGNVIIRKPATKGMENRKGVIFPDTSRYGSTEKTAIRNMISKKIRSKQFLMVNGLGQMAQLLVLIMV